ncbi:MAG: hypothetical protein CL578_16780 [Alteromonadaceae bacterium]|uniref:hypothetical protein n=1 Tax=Paraglaciecola chathamensis TaxID=368405 RepID=UPI000C430C24|nr:hypothetical protein [Paraglaciecola agarilytica]MBN26689.1 hypothetical protein [Alteromonadaceae bacterium]|tara:strand:+ start:22746 stop:23663 length:918 start_codon:yes stop_codon:yes gene_type:complete
MFRFSFPSLFLFIFTLHTHAKSPSKMETLAMEYAQVVGQIELVNVAFDEMKTRCETQITQDAKFLPEVDYLLRKNMDYGFSEFVDWMEGAAETQTLATQMVNQVLADHGGCYATALSHWFNYLTESNTQNLAFLQQNQLLFGLPKVTRSEHDIRQAFKRKITDYQTLPYQEIRDLASALDHGSYRYSLLSLSQSIRKDSATAQTMWQFAIDEFNQPEAYYALGKSLKMDEKARALNAFEQSAQMGYHRAGTWLGTYYACHQDMTHAAYWLDKAKEHGADPDYIDDIYAEIHELGKPTNCVNGWVY